MRGRFTSGKSHTLVMLLAGLLVSVFAGILTFSTTVLAADATWDGARLQYNGETYNPINDTSQVQDLDLSEGGRSYGVSHDTGNGQEFRVIHFSSVDDMATATSAQYIVYDFTPPDTFVKKTSSTISTEPAGENSGGLQGGLQQGTSCDVNGIGWIVCPVSNWLASGMDWLYGALTGFLAAQPLNITDRNSGQYVAWSIMLGIANVLFIIMFLVIIYSHVSSFGVSNYGIKKMLPRMIIAAVMVNLSFYICALAIDLSNIIGQGIQDMFIQIRNTMTTVGTSNGGDTYTWESITAAVLSSGAAVGAAGATFVITYSGVSSAALIMLLPLLLGLLLTVIVVLLVLAARQALIVILTIISPLAFACYLLPGTEKWFGKWRDLFFTMLIFFPAFSAVFGGAQLAGAAILQNANSIVMAILGLGVQVAPLAIAPLILKLSGGLLNRFAGIINNPSKGVIDKTRNWAEQQSQYLANRRSRSKDNLPKWAFARRLGRSSYHQQERRKERIANYQAMAEAGYAATSGHEKLDKQKREIEQSKQLIEKQLELNWNHHLKVDAKALEKDLKIRVTADQVELEKARLDNRYEEFKAGTAPQALRQNNAMLEEMRRAQEITRDISVEGLRKSNAQRVLNQQFAENMLSNSDIQRVAGGIYGDLGIDAAKASATSIMRSEEAKSIQESTELMKHFKLDATRRQNLIKGTDQTVTINGVSHTFRANSSFAIEAALEEQLAVGTVTQVKEILSMSGSGGHLSEYRGSISAGLAKSGVKGKAPFLGGKLIDDVYKGEIVNEQALKDYVASWVAGGKFKPSDVSIIDKEGLELLMDSIGGVGSTARSAIGEKRLKGLRKKIKAVFDSQELSANVADNALDKFRELYNSLPVPDANDGDGLG